MKERRVNIGSDVLIGVLNNTKQRQRIVHYSSFWAKRFPPSVGALKKTMKSRLKNIGTQFIKYSPGFDCPVARADLDVSVPTPEQRRAKIERDAEIRRQCEADDLPFDSMDFCFAHTEDLKANYGFGMMNGKLTYWDGRKYLPITIRQSFAIYKRITSHRSHGGHGGGKKAWMELVMAEFPA